MKGNRLVGKTIKKVHQTRVRSTSENSLWSLEAIEFTDGSFLRFVTIEMVDDYGLSGVYPAKEIDRDAAKYA